MAERPAAPDFDVALSYAGEDRAYVNKIATLLRDRGVKVFYDEFIAADLWGADLYALFDDVFRKRARFAILFVSRHYITKPWPKHERESAQARALVETSPYILPVKLDDAELPLRPTIGYVDARRMSEAQFVQLVLEKLGHPNYPVAPSIQSQVIRVPRTTREVEALLTRRPAGWEYMLFAGVLHQGKAELEPRWLDHQLRYVRPSGPYVSDQAAPAHLSAAMGDAQRYVQNAMLVLSPESQTAAFGPPGVAGDPARIQHLGKRLVGVYESLLDWVERIRGTRTSDKFRRSCDLVGAMMDNPITEIRQFIDRTVEQCDRIPDLLAQPRQGPVRITLELVVTIDPATAKAVLSEIERLR